MKSIVKVSLLAFVLLVVCAACAPKTTTSITKTEEANKSQMTGPQMTFDKRIIDLGKVKKGEKREIVYTFTNTGSEDVVISQVSTCDCTEVKSRPYLPIKPGENGTIEVIFHSDKKEDTEPVEIDIWLEKEDPNTGMPMLERIEYKFEFESGDLN